MLLLHQIGSVKIGEVVRYTVTYTPSADRILPSPEFLYLRIRNTCAIALRAAFVHGPYALSVAAYPSHFNPNEKFENPRRYGVPEFEPMLKAGGSWTCHLVVPDNIRQSAGAGTKAGYFGNGPEHEGESCSWIIECTSQVIFSTSAAVHFEVLLARDEKSLNLNTAVPVIGGQAQVPQPGRVSDYQHSLAAKDHMLPTKGVFSRAIRLKVEDTASLWDTPRLPGAEDEHGKHHKHQHHQGDGAEGGSQPIASQGKMEEMASKTHNKPKKVHLVVLTHGLHSNLGADMLFLKESIDAGVQQAKKDAKVRRAREREARRKTSGKDDDAGQDADDGGADEDEEVVVRGFSGNATRTERGIKYLGKRLARFVLSMTYPDQPFLPTGKAASEAVSQTLFGATQDPDRTNGTKPAHKHSTTHKVPPDKSQSERLYKITKISFIAHSLGGLVQTYAVAYIQKHSPQFFDLIEPVNFIALASPFLGLNHENPLYVKFALDFGLVGRTGQDLGLTWRAPTIARSGWGAIVSNLGENAHKRVYGDTQPESKPLLRILPTGPAHIALKKFRNRTLYSNVVNDGIVPLRTSCLLFLDWQGLERVEKARREAGLVETVVRTGWAEITGANVTTSRLRPWAPNGEEDRVSDGAASPDEASHEVPQPPTDATRQDDSQSLRSVSLPFRQNKSQGTEYTSKTNNNGTLSGLFNFFRIDNKEPSPPSPKQNKIYRRSQTINFDDPSATSSAASSQSKVTTGNGGATSDSDSPSAPPRTSFFESASDLLNPQLPTVEYIIDPSRRPRTIFHDRVYHPSDIPPPPLKRRPTGGMTLRRKSQSRTTSSSSSGQTSASSPFPSPGPPAHQDSSLSRQDYDDTANTNPDKDPDEVVDSSQMRVEEKIARAYHRDLSWRKVLVKLEPDAHNNLIVRRMFANAFGWPVVRHLVEAHFSDSAAARTRDEEESGGERARDLAEGPDETGQETKGGSGERSAPGLGIDVGGAEGQARGRSASQSRDATPVQRAGSEGPKAPALPDERTASEDREDTDKVSELPKASPRIDITDGDDRDAVPHPDSSRPRYERMESVAWSERDWTDSGDDNDSDEEGDGGKKDKAAKTPEKHGEPWNWTEKIVGKGALGRAKSPGGGGAGPSVAPAAAPGASGGGVQPVSDAATEPR
ncbi:DUF676-domain-containing protein [Coniochaeta ligniaria NRRL 30616]|uniref:DUF676-domain-containing protein n=1 Tax=Coniochaeta ligniaria NRRL 30616 TaxID=1408157 RepID=A0A1J7IXT1_9PEZI|nr:DUF676-domain-containing protein [Coniochaeta ligniaria NRRL 30616]